VAIIILVEVEDASLAVRKERGRGKIRETFGELLRELGAGFAVGSGVGWWREREK
jgi:hypothetical protein